MSNRLAQYGFTSGVISKTLWGQTVLEKYGYGLAACNNFIIDVSGSLISRAGSFAGAILKAPLDENYRVFPFIYAEEDANTYALVFTDYKVRFIQQGFYQLEAGKTVSDVTNNTNYTEFGITGHGYSAGDLVEFYGADVPAQLEGQTVEVLSAPDANTIRVTPIDITGNMDEWEDATPADITAYRVYTLATPYPEADLPGLYFNQIRDLVRITSLDYPVYNLERQADLTWTITEESFGINNNAPTNLATAARSAAGSAGVVFAVTAVDEAGEESLPSNFLVDTAGVDYTVTAGWIAISWTAVAGTKYYNIYRSIVMAANTEVHKGMELGYAGTAYATRFTDNNIIPDYTVTYPLADNPFVNQAITYIEVTNGGSNYDTGTTATINDTGSGTGASVVPVVSNGVIIGMLILDGGKNYSSPSVSLGSVGSGSGATFSITTSDASGNYPSISGTYQQRQIYASSANQPMVIWGSQIGLLSNFSVSRIVADDESYQFELSSSVLGVVHHLIDTELGLLAFTNLGVWLLTGSNGGAITPTDILAKQQNSVGASHLLPLIVEDDVLYAELHNRTIRLLQRNDIIKSYGGLDVSILAQDEFKGYYDINSWTYEQRPYRLVWTARNDGSMLSGTFSTEQKVYAWGTHDTQGLFEEVFNLPETARQVTYVVAQRYLSGRWIRTLEFFGDRSYSTNEDHCGVDCALMFGGEYPDADLTIYETDVVASAAIFSIDDVGKYISYRSGKAIIDSFNSTTNVTVTIINEFTDIKIPYTLLTRTIPSGEWRLGTLYTGANLPLNFRPQFVSVIGDGKVEDEVIVGADGLVEFSEDYTFGYIGLPFYCYAVTLPFSVEQATIEASRKNIKGVSIRYNNTRGILVGTLQKDLEPADQLDELIPIEQVAGTFTVEPDKLNSTNEFITVGSDWDEDAQLIIAAHGGFMSQVNGIVVEVDIGDEIL